MSLTGALHNTPLPQVLMSIEAEQRTGRLIITRGVPIANVYFAGGQWMVGERVGGQVSLAQQLVQAGVVNGQQLEFALGASYFQIITIPDRQLGQLMTSAALISQEQLREWLTRDAAEMLATMLQWQDGDYRFEDGVGFPPERLAIPLQTGILLAAVRPLPSPNSGSLKPLDAEVVMDFAEVSPQGDGMIELSREQWKILTQVDGKRPLWVLAEALQVPEETVRTVAASLVSGNLAVEVRRQKRP